MLTIGEVVAVLERYDADLPASRVFGVTVREGNYRSTVGADDIIEESNHIRLEVEV